MGKMKSKYWSLSAIVGFAAGLLYAPCLVLAATSPTLSTPGALGYSVLAGSIVTNTGPTTVNRNLGVSPSIGVPPHITGFPPGIVGPPGTKHDADANAAAAQADNTAAFGGLAQGCTTNYGAIVKNLDGLTLVPGVYCANAFTLFGTLTLDDTGAPNGVWIFRADLSTLITTTVEGSPKVQFLTGVGSSCNVWWRVASSATISVGTTFIGNILALTSIALQTNATLDGRAMAQTGAVTLDSNTISTPLCQAATTTTTSTTTTTLPSSTTSTTLPGATTSTTLPGATTSTTLPGATTTTTLPGATTTTTLSPGAGETTSTIVRIPAVGNWGMVMLALVFLGAIAWMVRARRSLR